MSKALLDLIINEVDKTPKLSFQRDFENLINHTDLRKEEILADPTKAHKKISRH
jgi:hypothetical protein